MEKAGGATCELQVQLPFLKNSASRLAKLEITTKEEKFITKVAVCKLELSAADWLEWKAYRLNFWKLSKAWGAGWGDKKEEEDDKDAKDKDGDEKMKE